MEGGQRWFPSFLLSIKMRYYSIEPYLYRQAFGEIYACNHPIYNSCTLYRIGEKGLAVIQQRFDSETKQTYWGEIDGWIANALYLEPKFHAYLRKRAGRPTEGLYPTATVRQAMWAARMKPLRKERWETVFDRQDI